MKSWIAQGRVKPTDYVWREGMSAWVAAGNALGQAFWGLATPAGAANGNADLPLGPSPGDSAPPTVPQAPVSPAAQQPVYMGLPPLGNAPGAAPSMVCGIIGTVLCVPCCSFVSIITEVAGLALGIIALTLARKAKALLAANPDLYAGQGMANAGFVLGIVAIALNILCLLISIVIVGVAFSPLLRHKF